MAEDPPVPLVDTPAAPRTEERYGELFDLTIDLLIKRVKAGSATSADLAVARDFLKNAGIKAIVRAGAPILQLQRALPKFDPEEDARLA